MATKNNNNYSNYSNSISEEYYKVSFVTTHSESIPKKMKQTGALIIMENVDTYRKSLWFRGELIASGFGFLNQNEANQATYLVTNLNEIFGGPNGVYDFLPGYIGPDGSEGKSVYQRFEEIWYSYNCTYEDFNERISYNRTSIDNNWTYTYNAYAYLLKKINSTYNELFTYSTSVYAMLDKADQDIRDAINSSYSYTWDIIDELNSYLLNYIKTSYEVGYATDMKIYNATYSYVSNMSDLLHQYINACINKLIGGAPETLDTLGEIAYLLRTCSTYGIDMWERLNDIQSTYVTHFEKQANGYTYINTYSYSLVGHEHQGFTSRETGPNTMDDLENWQFIDGQWYEYTYTYYTYTLEPDGYLAMDSDQISLNEPFNRYQLTYILERILPPYRYDIPNIYLSSKQEYELNNEVYEYGTQVKLDKVNAKFNGKDASGSTKIIYSNPIDGDKITSIENSELNSIYYFNSKSYHYTDDTNVQLDLGTIRFNSYPYQNLKEVRVEYNESYPRIYPEIKDLYLDIYDTAHVIPSGVYIKDIFENVRLQTRYRLWWWYDTELNTTDEANIVFNDSKRSKLILEKDFRTPVMLNDNIIAVYVAIPNNMIKYLEGIKLQNYDTGISIEIFKNPIQSELFNIKTIYSNYNIAETGMEIPYTIYKYSSNKWRLGDQFRILVEFTQLY